MGWNFLLLIMDYKFTAKMFDTSANLKVDNTNSSSLDKETNSSNWNSIFNCETNLGFCSSEILQIYAFLYWAKKNKITDFESRNVKKNLKRALKDHIFTKVKMELSQPTTDLFASRGNHKVKTFYFFYLICWLPDKIYSLLINRKT